MLCPHSNHDVKMYTGYCIHPPVCELVFLHPSFQSEATIAITILDDESVETLETFRVNLLRVIGGARLGEVTSVTVSIPPNDSPLGRFGFQELEVSLND